MAAVFRQWARGTPGLGDTWTARTQKLLGVGVSCVSCCTMAEMFVLFSFKNFKFTFSFHNVVR